MTHQHISGGIQTLNSNDDCHMNIALMSGKLAHILAHHNGPLTGTPKCHDISNNDDDNNNNN